VVPKALELRMQLLPDRMDVLKASVTSRPNLPLERQSKFHRDLTPSRRTEMLALELAPD
jgi:hypothetical protein